mgnify:CR=1 FL=1
MTYAEYQEYMRNFFEQYYQKLSQEDIKNLLSGQYGVQQLQAAYIAANGSWFRL